MASADLPAQSHYCDQSFRHVLLLARWIACDTRRSRFDFTYFGFLAEPSWCRDSKLFRAHRDDLLVLAFRRCRVGSRFHSRVHHWPLSERVFPGLEAICKCRKSANVILSRRRRISYLLLPTGIEILRLCLRMTNTSQYFWRGDERREMSRKKQMVNEQQQEQRPGNIIVPAPTPWPMVAALGLTLLCAGLVTHVVVSVVGLILAFRGAIGW